MTFRELAQRQSLSKDAPNLADTLHRAIRSHWQPLTVTSPVRLYLKTVAEPASETPFKKNYKLDKVQKK